MAGTGRIDASCRSLRYHEGDKISGCGRRETVPSDQTWWGER